MKEYFCLDCGKLLGQPIPGLISAWKRTSIKTVKTLGFVCDSCHTVSSKQVETSKCIESSGRFTKKAD